MKFLFIIIFVLYSTLLNAEQNSTKSHNDSFKVLSKNEIEKIVTNQTNEIFNQEKSWELDYIVYWLTAIMFVLMIYGLIVELKKHKLETKVEKLEESLKEYEKSIKKELKNDLESDLKTMLKEKTNSIINENIKLNLKLYNKKLSQREYFKNQVLYDISKWFSEKLKYSKSPKEIQNSYSWHNERLYIINKLAHGDKIQVEKSLKELQGSSAKDLLKLPSFKRFLKFLSEDDIDIDTLVKQLLLL